MKSTTSTTQAPHEPDHSPEQDKRTLDPEQQILHPYGVGIDTHSRFIQVCVLYRSAGAIRRAEREFRTTWPDLSKAHTWTLRVLSGLATVEDLRYCIESTGTYHLPVLMNWRGIPTVVNPLLAGATKRKTDVLDARLLAHHSITGLWKSSFIPTRQAQELRVLWAQRGEYARAATRASNRLNNILLRFGHTLGAEYGIRTPEGQGLISELIEGHEITSPCIAPDGLPDSMKGIIALLLEALQDNSKNANLAQKKAIEFIKLRKWPTGADEVSGDKLLDILQTVPGVGPATAAAWLSEVTDPRRFQSTKQVAAYCGCDPSLKISAGKVTSFTRRQGNTKLHYALSNAAAGLLRSPKEPLGLYGRSIAGRHKRGGWKKACGALARRIACGLWYVHTKNEPWSYEKYTFSQIPVVPDVPLKDIVGAAPARVLSVTGIRDSKQLAKAYYQGTLAAIPGFGEQSIIKLRSWLDTLPRESKRKAPNFPQGNPSPGGKHQTTAGQKTYVLKHHKTWSKTVKPKETPRTRKQS